MTCQSYLSYVHFRGVRAKCTSSQCSSRAFLAGGKHQFCNPATADQIFTRINNSVCLAIQWLRLWSARWIPFIRDVVSGRHWIGGNRGEILRASLKTLGIWWKSSVGIDARILLKLHINSYLWFKCCMTKNGKDLGTFSSFKEQCFLFHEKISNINIDSFVWFSVAQFHSNSEKVREFSRVVALSWNWDTERHNPTSSVSQTNSQVWLKKLLILTDTKLDPIWYCLILSDTIWYYVSDSDTIISDSDIIISDSDTIISDYCIRFWYYDTLKYTSESSRCALCDVGIFCICELLNHSNKCNVNKINTPTILSTHSENKR